MLETIKITPVNKKDFATPQAYGIANKKLTRQWPK